MTRLQHDQVWKWYKIIEDYKLQFDNGKVYCDKHGLQYKRFCNMLFRIEYKKRTNPELYERLIPLTKSYQRSGLTLNKFCKENNIEPKYISEMQTHFTYLAIIEKMKKLHETKQISFIDVTPRSEPINQVALVAQEQPQQEILKKQNDLELMIARGVKVIVSPDVGTETLLRIIELLKDL